MKLGMVGLGRMGYNMVLNLLDHKHKVIVYDVDMDPIKDLAKKGAIESHSVMELVSKLPQPRIVWIMIPSKFVKESLNNLVQYLDKGDIVIDGGNSYYKHSIKRYKKLSKKGIHFLDCGVSGGISGAREGACMMVGGEKRIFKKVEKLFKDMCVKEGYGYMGKSGSGHFVKGIHNGIEYGMMGALAEGFSAIENQKFGTDLKEVAKVYAHGSIIESRLASWLWDAFRTPGFLNKISCEVPEGETEEEMAMLEKLAPMPILHAARIMRVDTRRGKVCGKLIAAMRNLFGGHKVIKK
ncbi:MAG: decarboxylating 6-phosphogluconate dehydrogenase [Candidatus Woesearchaeota archaeon]